MRRRRAIHQEYESHDRWMVSYADFITLLFAFFVVMYAVSSVNEGKYRVLSEVMVTAFRSDPNASKSSVSGYGVNSLASPVPDLVLRPNVIAPELRPLPHVAQQIVPPVEPEVAVTASIVEEPAPPLDLPHEPDEIANEKLPDQTLDRAAFRLREAMSDLIRADLVTVRRKDHSVELEIKSNVLFASGSATISDLAVEPLSGIAAVMRDIPNYIQVEGFTDNVPIKTAVFPSNWELSAARAASVVHLLMKSGVQPERMTAIGYGEYRPAHDNDTEEGRNLNRRVVVVILGEDGRRDTDEDLSSPYGTPKLNLSGIDHG